ncbi:MAG: HEAT repeat domain-containing protein [Puniceicoccales bacterium]|jgi:hypothetical protein|nr:HEAT repeat domain-containing protein [Puniceicoccales bacterium]
MNTNDPHGLNEFSELSEKLRKLPAPATPSERMRGRLQAIIAKEKQAAGNVVHASHQFHRSFLPSVISTAAALVIGLFLGAHFLSPKSTTPTPAEIELAALRTKMDRMDRLMTYSLLQQENTGERFQTVLTTLSETKPDRHLLIDLVGTLAFEPSPNVRLSVVEGLSSHGDEPIVRAGILSALSRETSPMVQIAMISFLAEAHDTAAKPALEKLIADEIVDEAVRDTARSALNFLEKNTFDEPPKSILL